ncbi:hypothetical protein I79_026088 [Cricetulus griseus]|uniref:Uncharacterized protein n=1 Tax=Cricetulus griseus TaxID=10029 RepID=G3IQ03_CRIGR|nr:hypothetical protein I79_026088 [Cricetulus griseus]
MHTCEYVQGCLTKAEEGMRPSESGATGGCEPPDMGAGNPTPVLCKNRKNPQALSHRARAQVWFVNIRHLKPGSYLGSAIAAFRRLMMNLPWWKATPFCTWLFSDTG